MLQVTVSKRGCLLMADLGVLDATEMKQRVLDNVYALINASPGAGQTIELSPWSSIADLGLDSLRLLEIVFELEKQFGVEVDEAALAEVHSIDDLAELVLACTGGSCAN